MPKRAEGGDKPKFPERELYTLTDLEQIKVLADPLRVQLLEAFCQERTTKQVADLLGEKPTRLYHHVEAMERVGLIELSRTRQNRGTLEKYYLAVARAFRVAREVFPAAGETADEEAETLKAAVATYFDRTVAELGEVITHGAGGDLEGEGIITFCEVRGTEEEIRKIRHQLKGALQFIAALDPTGEGSGESPKPADRSTEPEVVEPDGGEERSDDAPETGVGTDAVSEADAGPQRRYRLTLAYFPLDTGGDRGDG